MAAPIAAVVLASPSRKSVRLHSYVSTEKEGQKKGDRFVAQSGLNGCIPEFAERQFRDNRKRWGKNAERTVERGGRKFVEGQYVQAYHLIQSFARNGVGALDPASSDDWEKAHELGMLLAKRVAGEGRMATVTTQIDGKTGCLHNHIVIDSVDKITGRSFDSAGVKHKVLAAAHDEVLKDAGYEQVNTLTNGAVKVEKSELLAAAKHAEWEADPSCGSEPFSVAVLKKRIREAMSSPRSFDLGMFMRECYRLGVDVQRSTARNGQGLSYRMMRLEDAAQGTYLPPARGDVRRAAKLGTEFTMDAVQAAIVRNLNTPRQHQTETTTQPTIPHTTPVPDKSEKFTPDAAALGVPASADAPLSQDARKADPFADMWAEREASADQRMAAMRAAMKLSEPLEETSSEKSAEAAQTAPEQATVTEVREQVSKPVEREEPTSYAAAPDMGAPADAPLSHGANNEFRSLLRDVRVRDQKRQQLIDDMALFDERAVAALEAGGMFTEADAPKGVGRKFLDVYGERVDPEVLFILDQRETKKEAATALWERAHGRTDPLAQMRREKARKIRDEVRAGDYDLDDSGPEHKRQDRRKQDESQASNDEPSL